MFGRKAKEQPISSKKNNRAIDTFIGFLQCENDVFARSNALKTLQTLQLSAEIKKDLMDALANALSTKQFWPYRNKEFIEAMVTIGGEEMIERLIYILENKNGDEFARARAVAAFTIGEIANRSWNKYLASNYRTIGATYPSGVVDKRALNALLKCFISGPETADGRFVSYFAWNAINEIKSVEVAEPLIEALEKNEISGYVTSVDMCGYETSVAKRACAFQTIGYCDAVRAIPMLAIALQDKDDNVSYAAVGALSNIASPEALQELDRAKSVLLGNGAVNALKFVGRDDPQSFTFKVKFAEKWAK